jgi:hypothetical protein
MRKKIVPIVLALVIVFVLLIVVDQGLREKARVIVEYISSWLGIDWGPTKSWRSAEWLYHLSSLLA